MRKFLLNHILIIILSLLIAGCSFDASIKDLAATETPKITVDIKTNSTAEEDISAVTVPVGVTKTFYLFKWNRKGEMTEIKEVQWSLDSTQATLTLSSDLQSAQFISNTVGVYNLNIVSGDLVKSVVITVDNVTPTISINDQTVSEGATSVSLDVTLSNSFYQSVTVDWTTANGTAVTGGDYTAASGTLTFAAGETSKTISITLLPDTLDEINESFTVSLSNPTNSTILDGTGVVSITDDDSPPALTVADVTENENVGTATVTISLNTISGQNVSFDWTTANNTALAGSDYTASSGTTKTIAAGATSTTVTVPITDDTMDEASETFYLNISNALNASIADNSGLVTITDNDAAPTISVANASATEGSNVVFTVSLSAASGQSVTFDWATSDGTATLANSDYTSSSGTAVTIAAGATSTTISVPTTSDATIESNETFTVTLSSPVNATNGTMTATGTITNDDVPGATTIYRSVGPGSTSDFVWGSGGNDLTIASGVATFAWTMPNQMGVGDAIQYDSDNNSSIDAIVFVHGRIDSTHFTVRNAAGAVPANLTIADQNWMVFRAYTSLANAAAGIENTGIDVAVRNFDSWTNGRDLVAVNEQWNITLYADATDTASVDFDGTYWKTSATNYLRIYTPYESSEVGASQRHRGVWTSSAYNMVCANQAIIHSVNYIRIDGVQASQSNNGNYIDVIGGGPAAGASAVYYSNNITRNMGSGSNGAGISANGVVGDNTYAYIWNNISYSTNQIGYGIYGGWLDAAYIYNNTIYNVTSGITTNSATASAYVKNNIVMNIGGYNYDAYAISNCTACDYNISSTNISSGGANDKLSQTVAFVDSANWNLRLASSDSSARGAGTNLSADANLPFTTDIDGSIRTSPWDIGAHQVTDVVYRSVGPSNTTALASGSVSNNITIQNSAYNGGMGTAIFDTALANNIGVGDVIQYDSNSDTTIDAVLFIAGRVSSTQYFVQTSNGGYVSLSGYTTQYWNIYRAYTSLANAIAGSENTGITASVRDFDTFTSGNDIAAQNLQWNIALYADAIDTTATEVNNWTTSFASYLKLYTPYASTEVGTSQRHSGTWASGGYTLNADGSIASGDGLLIGVDHVVVEGLKMESTNSTGYRSTFMISFADDVLAQSNIVRSQDTGSPVTGFFAEVADNQVAKFVNNISYCDGCLWFTSFGAGSGKVLFYNNTAAAGDNDYGFYIDCNYLVEFKNNISILQGATGTGYGYACVSGNSTNNLSSDASAPGSNAITNASVTFVAPGSYNYLLSTSDTSGAKTGGADLSSDSYIPFSIDILGATRSAPWSIGASNPY